MQFRSRIGAVAFALVLASAVSAPAAVITFDGFTSLSVDVNYTHQGVTEHGPAGQMMLTIDGTPFIGYCVDLDNDAPNTWTATLEPVSVISNGIKIAYLFDTFAGGVTTMTETAGLQVAIWEVLDDGAGTLNLLADNFRANSPASVRNQAQLYLNAIPADLSGYVPQSLIVFSSAIDQAQHMIVPEPGSIAGLILGAAMVLRRTRR